MSFAQFNRGADPTRRYEVGFCDTCGRVLEPMDYLSCSGCYQEKKRTKRRYHRATGERQLAAALQRVQRLADNPMQCHWLPYAVILFGSMLKTDGSSIGDVDLCIMGSDTRTLGLETTRELIAWAAASAPRRFSSERLISYPPTAAEKFIRQKDQLLALVIQSDFESIGGGRPFPYRIVWTGRGVDAGSMALRIEARRPIELAMSIHERAQCVREAEVRCLQEQAVPKESA